MTDYQWLDAANSAPVCQTIDEKMKSASVCFFKKIANAFELQVSKLKYAIVQSSLANKAPVYENTKRENF